MASTAQPLPRPPSAKRDEENDPNLTDWSWLTYWRRGGDEVPDELTETVGSQAAISESSQKAVSDAVALVVGSSRNGLVGLCTAVAKILKAKSDLEKKLVDLEASAVESHAGEATASRGTSSVSLPRISSAQVRPVSRDSGTVNVESSTSLESIRDLVPSSQTDLMRGKGEPPIAAMLQTAKDEISTTLADIRSLTTHDDNVERQYRETVDINQRLEQELERMRREMRKLRGKLSLAEVAPRKLRAEMARREYVQRRKHVIDEETRENRPENERHVLPRLLTAEERSCVVNARGEYINSKSPSSRSPTNPRQNTKTPSGKNPDTLPPTLYGCNCSVCRSVQSMKATSTANDARVRMQAMVYSSQGSGQAIPITRGGQQIFLGDKVIVKGERAGMVKYIGKLEGVTAKYANHVFLGLHLDHPIGRHDGVYEGQRYFTSPPRHGAFVNVRDVTCVITRQAPKPASTHSPSRIARLKQEQEQLKNEASRQKKERARLVHEMAKTEAKLREQESIMARIEQKSEETTAHEAQLNSEGESGIVRNSKGYRPPSGMTEDSDVADLKTRIDQLMDKKPKTSKGLSGSSMDIDKHTVEEAIGQVLQLADMENTGWIDTEDFIHLLNSQALCMNLTDAEADLLVKKSQSSLKKQVNYRLLTPSLLDHLATVKVDGGSKQGVRDWCHFYSKVHERVVYYNLRSGKVQLKTPSEVNRERTVTLDTGRDIEKVLESNLLEVLEAQDVGKSGFIAPGDLGEVLKSCSISLQLSDAQAQLVLGKCSQQWDPVLGIPYINYIPQLRQFMSDSIRETAEPGGDVWCEMYSKKAGLFYLNKRTGAIQTVRPSGKLL